MKRSSLFFVAMAMASFVTAQSVKTTDLQRLSRAHLEFALDLFRGAGEQDNNNDNVLLSPYSVASLLSQLWIGTGDSSESFRELEKRLHYRDPNINLSPDKVHKVFASSLDTLADPDFKSVVAQGNALFLQQGLNISQSFIDSLSQFYNSSLQRVDFGSDAERVINAWVRERTEGLIPSLLDTPPDPNTKILLANALCLKAFWKHSFDTSATAANGIFHVDSENRLEVPMMAGKFKVLLGQSRELGVRLLELPFRGKRLSMFILLPDEGGISVGQLQRNLTAPNLKKLFATLREEMVHIRLPRFRAESSSRLTELLSRLGLVSIFDPSQSDFSKITTEEKLAVTSIAHKVTLEITEKGATAAAATSTGIERFGEVGEFFEVNRPFVFFIWDYHSGALLFIGRINRPEPH